MSVFKISDNYRKCAKINPAEEYELPGALGEPIAEFWGERTFLLNDPDCDVTPILSCYRGLMVTEEVLQSPLGQLLRKVGEVIQGELADTGEPIYYSNVTEFYSCLDGERSLFRHSGGILKHGAPGPGEYAQVKEAFIKRSAVGRYDMFRIPEARPNVILINDPEHPREDSLYQALMDSPWADLVRLEPLGTLVD